MTAQSLTICKCLNSSSSTYTIRLVHKDGSESLLTSRNLFWHDVEHLLYNLSYSKPDEDIISAITKANNQKYNLGSSKLEFLMRYYSQLVLNEDLTDKDQAEADDAIDLLSELIDKYEFVNGNRQFNLNAWFDFMEQQEELIEVKHTFTVRNSIVICN